MKTKSNIMFPREILGRLVSFLKKEEVKLSKRKKDLEKQDPYNDASRLIDNASSDTDAAEVEGHARISALKKEIDKGLIRIRKTLTKVKLGKYGICEGCGKLIDTDRLAVNPTAAFCIECQKKQAEK